jgi:predicted TIM-barrel fold metal-dependent hydrolase
MAPGRRVIFGTRPIQHDYGTLKQRMLRSARDTATATATGCVDRPLRFLGAQAMRLRRGELPVELRRAVDHTGVRGWETYAARCGRRTLSRRA